MSRCSFKDWACRVAILVGLGVACYGKHGSVYERSSWGHCSRAYVL